MQSSKSNKTDAAQKQVVSSAVINRLPRYFRYLRELLRAGKTRISSGELAKMMNLTAPQIRQDLNCFGGFGQQGYGYNVRYLYTKISDILGAAEGYRAIIIGAGNLGRALVRTPMFAARGVSTIAMFDVDKNVIGCNFSGVNVYSMDELESFCDENGVDIAILTLPKTSAKEVTERLSTSCVRGIWNFTGIELGTYEHVKIVNVHLGDSLMTLCYEIKAASDSDDIAGSDIDEKNNETDGTNK